MRFFFHYYTLFKCGNKIHRLKHFSSLCIRHILKFRYLKSLLTVVFIYLNILIYSKIFERSFKHISCYRSCRFTTWLSTLTWLIYYYEQGYLRIFHRGYRYEGTDELSSWICLFSFNNLVGTSCLTCNSIAIYPCFFPWTVIYYRFHKIKQSSWCLTWYYLFYSLCLSLWYYIIFLIQKSLYYIGLYQLTAISYCIYSSYKLYRGYRYTLTVTHIGKLHRSKCR